MKTYLLIVASALAGCAETPPPCIASGVGDQPLEMIGGSDVSERMDAWKAASLERTWPVTDSDSGPDFSRVIQHAYLGMQLLQVDTRKDKALVRFAEEMKCADSGDHPQLLTRVFELERTQVVPLTECLDEAEFWELEERYRNGERDVCSDGSVIWMKGHDGERQQHVTVHACAVSGAPNSAIRCFRDFQEVLGYKPPPFPPE